MSKRKFKVGDRVRLIKKSDVQTGCTGEVICVYRLTSFSRPLYSVQFDGRSDHRLFYSYDLEKAGPIFKTGDTVRITDSCFFSMIGRRGVVNSISIMETPGDQIRYVYGIRLFDPETGALRETTKNFREDQLEKLIDVPDPKFHVGDTVVAAGDTVTKVLEIQPHPDYTYTYLVVLGNYKARFREDQLELYVKNEQAVSRNVSITLEQAQEYYKEGGELKKIALMAFTEEEIRPRPHTWLEYLEFNKQNGKPERDWDEMSRYLSTDEITFIKLRALRNAWIGDWKPTAGDEGYVIVYKDELFKTLDANTCRGILTFPSREMANEFISCFKTYLYPAKRMY